MLIKSRDGNIKSQILCYKLFALYVIGDTTITTGLIRRAKKFGFVIVLMTYSFRIYGLIGKRLEGNTILHRKQYEYKGLDLARFLVKNKILNQIASLQKNKKKI